jgi:hypothetical protein
MACGVEAIGQDGMSYSDDNIVAMLIDWHATRMIWNSGGGLKGDISTNAGARQSL